MGKKSMKRSTAEVRRDLKREKSPRAALAPAVVYSDGLNRQQRRAQKVVRSIEKPKRVGSYAHMDATLHDLIGELRGAFKRWRRASSAYVRSAGMSRWSQENELFEHFHEVRRRLKNALALRGTGKLTREQREYIKPFFIQGEL